MYDVERSKSGQGLIVLNVHIREKHIDIPFKNIKLTDQRNLSQI